jgi:hypothetical protein
MWVESATLTDRTAWPPAQISFTLRLYSASGAPFPIPLTPSSYTWATDPPRRQRCKRVKASFLKGSWLAFAALERAHLHRERGTPRPTPNQGAQPTPVQPPEPALPLVPPQPPPPPPPLLTPALVPPLHPTEPLIPPALQSRRHPHNAPPLCLGCKALFFYSCYPSPPGSSIDTHSSPPSDSVAG